MPGSVLPAGSGAFKGLFVATPQSDRNQATHATEPLKPQKPNLKGFAATNRRALGNEQD
jgi:hypothetical protein